MNLLIGRKSGVNNLLILVGMNNEWKATEIGNVNTVPTSVSRCKPEQKTAHCKITTDARGGMTIENLNPLNKTYVEGIPIQKKAITASSLVQLGNEKYALDLSAVMNVVAYFSKNSAQANIQKSHQRHQSPLLKEKAQAHPPCDIRPLEEIYSMYEEGLASIDADQKKKNNMGMFPLMLGSLGSAATAVLGSTGGLDSKTTMILSFLPVLGFILYIFVFISKNKDTTQLKKKELKNWLADNYVCPNTGKFLGYKEFKILRQEEKCPYCHGKRIV